MLDQAEFRKVGLRNQTLSCKNVKVELPDLKGNLLEQSFELIPDILYRTNYPANDSNNKFFFGSIIRKTRIRRGMSQDELAVLSDTSKTYISRVESDLIEPESSTFYKIVELGLGKKIKVEIK